MANVHTLKFGNSRSKAVLKNFAAAVVFAVLTMTCANTAHADTYLFTFTANDLLTDLAGFSSSTGYNAALTGTYAVFFQPQNSYTAKSSTAQDATWKSAPAINTNSAAFSGDGFASTGNWIGFYKDPAQTTIDVITSSAKFPASVHGESSGDPTTDPSRWGTTTLQANVMSTADVFTFTLNIPTSSSATFATNFSIYASGMVSRSPLPGFKEQAFGPSDFISLTGTQTPEPAPAVFLAIGGVLLFLGLRKKNAAAKVAGGK